MKFRAFFRNVDLGQSEATTSAQLETAFETAKHASNLHQRSPA